MARHHALEARKFAGATLMTKRNLAVQDLPVQLDHPAATSLMVLPAANLMVVVRVAE